MNSSNRRTFIKDTTTLAAGAVALGVVPSARAIGANEKIVIGLIGPGGMGTNLLKSFAAQKDVEIAYVCDVDTKRLADAVKISEGITGNAPRAEKEMRRVLEDKAVDAVVIATPDHWHAPATILACDAGKHV